MLLAGTAPITSTCSPLPWSQSNLPKHKSCEHPGGSRGAHQTPFCTEDPGSIHLLGLLWLSGGNLSHKHWPWGGSWVRLFPGCALGPLLAHLVPSLHPRLWGVGDHEDVFSSLEKMVVTTCIYNWGHPVAASLSRRARPRPDLKGALWPKAESKAESPSSPAGTASGELSRGASFAPPPGWFCRREDMSPDSGHRLALEGAATALRGRAPPLGSPCPRPLSAARGCSPLAFALALSRRAPAPRHTHAPPSAPHSAPRRWTEATLLQVGLRAQRRSQRPALPADPAGAARWAGGPTRPPGDPAPSSSFSSSGAPAGPVLPASARSPCQPHGGGGTSGRRSRRSEKDLGPREPSERGSPGLTARLRRSAR